MGIKEQLAAQSRPLSKEEIFSLFTEAEEELVKPSLETLNEIGAYNLLVDLRDAALTPEQKPFILKNIVYYHGDASSPQTLVQRIVEHGARSYSSQEMMTRWKLFGMTSETEEELFSILKRKYELDGVVESRPLGKVPEKWLNKDLIMANFTLNWSNVKGRVSGCFEIEAFFFDYNYIYNTYQRYFRILITGLDLDFKKESVCERFESKWIYGKGEREKLDPIEIEQAVARVYLQTITPSKNGGEISQEKAKEATSGKTVHTEVATPSPNPDFQFLLQKIAAAEVVSKLGEIEDTLRKRR